MQPSTELPGVVIGEVVAIDTDGRPRVHWNHGEPMPAEVVWMASPPDWSACVGARIVLGFIDGDESRPIVLGLLDPPPAPGSREREVLRIASGRELVIECGQAKIALRADGRIEIRGTHLVSRSSGPNKVKGASVHIN